MDRLQRLIHLSIKGRFEKVNKEHSVRKTGLNITMKNICEFPPVFAAAELMF